jgi:hypothetical protein
MPSQYPDLRMPASNGSAVLGNISKLPNDAFSARSSVFVLYPFCSKSMTRILPRLFLATLTLVSIPTAIQAQTAPQLLPYTSRLIAGGVSGATFTVGGTCPQAGAPNVATDTYGDGCLATEISLTGPRYAIADTAGNVFFSDYTNGLVRRVDAVTGIVTAVAGGGAALAKNATCGAYTSTDILGDGCLGTAVKLGKPAGLAFDASGDLIFADSYNYSIRKIAATNGLVPATGGIISLVAGDVGGTVSTGGFSSGVNAATSSYVEDVYGIAYDTAGNLYYADEYSKAEDVSVINTTASSDVVTGITVPAGYTMKIAGATAGGGACINAPTSGFGCTYGTFPNNTMALATVTQLDAPYAVAPDSLGNVYIANEYENSVAKVNAAGVLTLYAGTNSGTGNLTLPNTTRALATTVAIGTDFGVAADHTGNVYVTDASLGYVWRVDAATQFMYVVAGGGSGSCSSPNALDTPQTYDTADTYGDGCTGLQAKLGAGTDKGGYTTTGVFGVTVDGYENLYLGDTVSNLVREIATGAQFGVVGANQPVNTLDIHFAAGDSPASASPYTLTAGATNFSLGTASCTYNNADTTTDCLLPVTATPSTLGVFTGMLQVASKLGSTATFALSGNYEQSPNTRTSLSYTTGVSCAGTTTYATTTPAKLTAIVSANGPSAPVGNDSITFYANNGTTTITLGNVAVSNIGTASNPVYGAVLSYTFSTPATYTLTAVYSGDSYFKTSTGTAPTTFTSALPGYTISPIGYQQSSVAAGQTALYSFNVNLSVFTGPITFTVSGMPQNATYSLSPQTITGSGCSSTSTVALSILTQQQQTVQPGGIDGTGRGGWRVFSLMAGLVFALLAAFGRRKAMRFSQITMLLALLMLAGSSMGCGKAVGTVLQPATPAGTYNITVTASSTSGTAPAPITFPLTVQK